MLCETQEHRIVIAIAHIEAEAKYSFCMGTKLLKCFAAVALQA